MTIIQLEYLLAVANCGSFSLAAEHCFVTQPSLSMQVKALEEELGVVLLDRSKKPVIPTEAGEVVLEQARETIKAYNYIKEAVSELKGETAGKLRLGVIPTIAPYLLHKFIPAFVRDYPKVELEISEMITSDIVEALKRDDLKAFFETVIASGESSWKLLQNLYVPASDNQEMPLALEMSRRMLSGRGAWRIHGGGFAGTVQAFVPLDMLDSFVAGMDGALGEGACHVLSIRPQGGVEMVTE